MRAGAADAVRGASAPVEELRYILEDCAATALIVQNADLWRRLQLDSEQRGRLRFVLQLEGDPVDDLLSWDNLLRSAQGRPELALQGDAEATATVLYTSGTTGQPKGVPLTHANLLHQMRSLACVAFPEPGSPVLSVLPIWHAYERSASYYFLSCACSQTYTTIKQLKKDLPGATDRHGDRATPLGGGAGRLRGRAEDLPPARQRLLKRALANSAGTLPSVRPRT